MTLEKFLIEKKYDIAYLEKDQTYLIIDVDLNIMLRTVGRPDYIIPQRSKEHSEYMKRYFHNTTELKYIGE